MVQDFARSTTVNIGRDASTKMVSSYLLLARNVEEESPGYPTAGGANAAEGCATTY